MAAESDPVGRVEQRLDGLVARVDSHGERISGNEARLADHDRQLLQLAKTAENTTRLIAVVEAQQEDIKQLATSQEKLANGQEAIKTDLQHDRDDRVRREDQGRKDSKQYRVLLYGIFFAAASTLIALMALLLTHSPHA